MNRYAATALIAGLVFGAGLGVSGMTDPTKVLAFLDFFGDWDPSLALVMGSALLVNAVASRWVFRRARPLLDVRFHMPIPTAVDVRLVAGSALFGLGWGLSGYCPGAAIAAVGTGAGEVLVFLGSMAAGMALFRVFDTLTSTSPARGAVEAAAE